MSLDAVYAPTEVCGADEKEMFYTNLDSVLDHCTRWDTLIVLGDFNAVTGTERAGSGTRNTNSPEFIKIQKVDNCRFLVSENRAAPLDLV